MKKHLKKAITGISLLLLASSAYSHSSGVITPVDFDTKALPEDVGPVLVGLWNLETTDEALIENIKQEFEVRRKTENTYEIYVPANRVNIIKEIAPVANMVTNDSSAGIKAQFNRYNIKNYRSINEVYLAMINLEKQYPDFIKLYEYGVSAGAPERGVKVSRLIAVKFSDNVQQEEDETNLMFTAATHGDELITTESMLRHMERLAQSYQNGDQTARQMIDNNELFFIPVVNPDGFRHVSRYTADGTDPNRSYPFVNEVGSNRNYAKCIQELMKFHEERNFKGTIDFHAFGELVLLPYADTTERVSNYNEYSQLGQLMNPRRRYKVTQISHDRGIGIATGSSVDYFHSRGSTAFGIELARTKVPRRDSDIETSVSDVSHIISTYVNSFQ